MQPVTKIILVLLSTITFAVTAHAHDPSLHVKKAEKADCSKMDYSNMDANDPVAVAMIKKCKKQAEATGEEMDHDNVNHDDMKNDEKAADKNSEDDQS